MRVTTAADAAQESIEQFVDAVHGHARTLARLAPALRARGVDATRTSLVELMAEMEQTFPGHREKSVFASVELSLRRMSKANRDRARVLGVFHSGAWLARVCRAVAIFFPPKHCIECSQFQPPIADELLHGKIIKRQIAAERVHPPRSSTPKFIPSRRFVRSRHPHVSCSTGVLSLDRMHAVPSRWFPGIPQ